MSKKVLKSKTLTYIITANEAGAKGRRADQILPLFEEIPSRSQLKYWFESGAIRCKNNKLKPSSKIYLGDKIQITPPPKKQIELEPRDVKLEILFEDADLIVIHKPKGMSMHPGAGRANDTTLAHALLAHSKKLSTKSGDFRPGIVHRLDKDTEGLVVVAKNNEVHEALSKQFSNRTIDRNYWALCWGKLPSEIVIEGNIGRSRRDRKKMAVHAKGKPSKTIVKRVRYFEEGYTLVDCKLMSGRTHQIRVHLAHMKHGLLGDTVYSRKRRIDWSDAKENAYSQLRGQALIAYRLGFVHPNTSKKLDFKLKYPEWMLPFIKD